MDWATGGTEPETIERKDGVTDSGAGHELYLAKFEDWPSFERKAIRYARGRVIDLGCGAGRVALHLQDRGFDVVGADSSPLAMRAARFRGVKKTWRISVDDLSPKIHMFDTVVLFGNNFGIFGSPQRLRKLLTHWAVHMPPIARVLAESTSPYFGGVPTLDRSYCLRNKQHGLMPGQVRIRTRYRDLATPWFPWLFVSRSEMRQLLRGTGWHEAKILGATHRDPFVAVLEKD